MAKLPIYTQQYKPDTRRAAAEDFGSMEGRALSDLGEAMMAFNLKRQKRNNTLQRVLAEDEFARERHDAYNDLTANTSPQALANPKLLAEQEQYWKQRRAEIVNQFEGTEEDKIELTKNLSRINTDYYKRTSTDISKAQFEVIKNRNSGVTRQYADMAGDDPANTETYIKEGQNELDKLAPTMSDEVLDEAKRNLAGEAIHSAVDTMIKQDQHEAALALLNSEDAAATLSPETMRSLKTAAIAGEAKVISEAEKVQAKLDAKLAWLQAQGVEVTPNIAARIAGAMGTTRTPAEQMQDLQTIGITLTPDQQRQYLRIEAYDPKRTAKYSEDELRYFRGNVDRFASGQMSPEEEREFTDRVSLYSQQTVNAQMPNGSVVPVPIGMPEYLRSAYEQRGIDMSVPPAQQMREEKEQAVADEIYRQETRISSDVGGLYMMAHHMAGPNAIVQAGLAGMPFFGQTFDEGQAMRTTQQQARSIQRKLTKSFVMNKKYPVALVKQAEADFAILASLWDNPRAYRGKLEEIDKNLDKMAKDLSDDLLTGRALMSSDDVSDTLNAIRDIQDYRSSVNVPRKMISNPDEWKSLPPGTMFKTKEDKAGEGWYIDEQGSLHRIQ